MDIRHLQYVLKVAEEKSFSRAAEKLHIAQPSLSQQILKLEQQLGVKLFDRSTSPLELTYGGERFIEMAGQIIDQMEQLRKEMEDVAELKKGRMVVGSLPITGSHMLPAVLPIFQKKFPGIEVVLMEETTSHLEELTAKGKTDFTLLTLPLQEEGLVYEPVVTEEILLAVPPGHKLARKGKIHGVNLSSLQGAPFILLKRGQGFRQIAMDLFQQAGFEPNIIFESSNIEMVQSLVASGMGLAFVPSMVARSGWTADQPVYRQIKEHPTRTIVVAYRKGRYLSRAAREFIGILQQTVQAGKGNSFEARQTDKGMKRK